MSKFIPWNSQPLESWSEQYAEGNTLSLNGLPTHYLEMGEEQPGKTPLIFLHGFCYDSLIWSKNLPFLAQHFKIYALDFWGFGYSAREPLDYGYPLFAEQIKLFMEAMQISKATLVGHGMGAGAAIQFAHDHINLVEQLVLVDAFGLPNSSPMYAKFMALPVIGPFLMNMRSTLFRSRVLNCHLYEAKELATEEHVTRATWSQKIYGTHEVFYDIYQREFLDKLSDEIHHLGDEDIPILLVWGRQDRIVPFTRGEHMQKVLKGSKLEIINDAGHLVNYQQVDIFNNTLLEFLSGQDSPTSVETPPLQSESKHQERAG